MKVGSIVRLMTDFPAVGGKKDDIAVVYYIYDDGDNCDPGISIITTDGNDLGGFSCVEQEAFLNYLGETNFEYEFKNMIRMQYDLSEGKFEDVFRVALTFKP